MYFSRYHDISIWSHKNSNSPPSPASYVTLNKLLKLLKPHFPTYQMRAVLFIELHYNLSKVWNPDLQFLLFLGGSLDVPFLLPFQVQSI